jgi:arylsulfatase
MRRWKAGLLATIVSSAILLSVHAGAAEAAEAARRADSPGTTRSPNIIVVVFDDLGFSDLGCFGSEIRTPVIDAVAAGGLRYNRFDNKAICSASRAALLTGRNNQTVKMGFLPSESRAPDPNDTSPSRGELPLNAQMLPEALREAGYATFAVGKWHLTPAHEGGPGGVIVPETPRTSWPLQRGFDRFYGFLGGWTDQYKPDLVEGNAPIPAPTRPGYHVTEDLIDHAIANLQMSRNAAPEKPVFMYLALGVPHSPFQAPARHVEHYRTAYSKGWDEIREERYERAKALGVIPANTTLPPRAELDAPWSSLDAQHQRVFSQFMAAYAGFIEHGDEQLGRLVDYLKSSGQYDDTLLMIISDNGAAGEGGAIGGFQHGYGDKTTVAEMDARLSELGGPTIQPLYQRPWAMASNAPLRRYKLWPFAGGTRSPLIVSWPRAIRDRGAVRQQNVDIVDLAPTLVDVAGARFDAHYRGTAQIPVAGKSVRATFTSAKARTRGVQFFELSGNRAIRSGRWKAVAMHRFGEPFSKDEWMLFDTAADYSESKDLARSHPRKLKELQALWESQAREYGALPLNGLDPQVRRWNSFDNE